MNIKAHMIRHTHWDREWYLPFETFRTKLVRLIDSLLEEIDTNPQAPVFMLDGQTIVIEDYLEVRPNNKKRLTSAIKSGKITIGPWYILPDELLISGESHIRNYMYGQELCKQYGKSNDFAYLPDSFGHPAQMPQIITGLGLTAMLFWRGTSNKMDKTEFYWESLAKGIKLLCVHLPCGYGNSARLSEDLEKTVKRLDDMIDTLAEISTVDVVLLMNGSDHIIGQANATQIVEGYNNSTKKPYKIVLSTINDFLKEVTAKIGELKTYSGEISYGDRALLLGGTASTRTYLKQHHKKAETMMERYLEPLFAFESITKGKYDFTGYADYIWKSILKNAPHDSICGCSVDEVHRAMIARYEEIDIAQKTQFEDMCASICAPSNIKEEVNVLVFEPTSDKKQDLVQVEVDFDPMLIREVDFARSAILEYEDEIIHPSLPTGIEVFDEKGNKLPALMLKAQKAEYMYLQDEAMPETYKVNKATVLVNTNGMDYGVHCLTIKKGNSTNKQSQESKNYIENEFYKIEFEKDSFSVLDKKTGRTHREVCKLIDVGDAGDEYSYSWPKKDSSYTFEATAPPLCNVNSLCQTLEIQGRLMLPTELMADRQSRSEELTECKVNILVKLNKDTNRIDFNCNITNTAKDHKLLVSFPSGTYAKTSSAFSTFALNEFPIEVEIPKHYEEYPKLQHMCHGYASISDESYGITAGIKGICEYEAVNKNNQSYLMFTLLRCVGWLSRPDLLSRNGNGGWMIPTPQGQCIGSYDASFCVTYHNGDILTAKAYTEADRFLFPQKIYPMFKQEYIGENKLKFLSDLPSEIRISAVKTGKNNAIVVRIVNIGKQTVNFTLNIPCTKVYYANLAEQKEKEIANTGGFAISVNSAQIITLLIEGMGK